MRTSGRVPFAGQAWKAPLGGSFLGSHQEQLTEEHRSGSLATRDGYVYSSLGTVAAGRAVAAAAGMSYPELMRTRLFEPLGMTHTAIQTSDPLVAGGRTASGLPARHWIFDAYAPAGAAVSTAGDLATLATALLKGTAQGMAALHPTAATGQANTRIGTFWHSSRWQTGQTIVWHDGLTGGYSSYLGLDQRTGRAVVVLSDVGTPATTDLGIDLLAQRR